MRWALIGAAGFVAPRHMRAIRDVGGELVAACDLHDSVGILDEYAPGCMFTTDPEMFWSYLRRHTVDAVSICTPNHLHLHHAVRAMEVAPLVICEKPLVTDAVHLRGLEGVARRTGATLATILQLRHHPEARRLKGLESPERVTVRYTTTRGPWYDVSWKGDPEKSGGIVTNIGVHLFDLLIWAFGLVRDGEVHTLTDTEASGTLHLERTTVDWLLSTDPAHGTERSVVADGESFDFTGGFTDLHADAYRAILDGDGPGIEDARPSIELVQAIRCGPREAVA